MSRPIVEYYSITSTPINRAISTDIPDIDFFESFRPAFYEATFGSKEAKLL